MADIQLTADVSQPINQLKRLQDQTDKVTKAFSGLKSLLGSLAFGAAINSAVKFADSIQDLNDVSNIATGTILGFTNAVEQNGGKAEGASNSILKLLDSISEANSGSLQLQDSFNSVGVSLSDLRTLSEEDILKKTIDGLAKIDDVSKRSKLSVDLLGKGMKGVNVQGLASGLNSSISASSKYADSIKSAADAQQQLDITIRNFQIALLNAIKPVLDLVSKINLSIDAITHMIKVLLVLGATLLGLTVWGRVVSLLSAAVTGLGLAAETLGAGLLNLSLRFTAGGRIAAFFSDALATISMWFSRLVTLFPSLGKFIAYIGTLLQPLAGLFIAAGSAIGVWWNDLKKMFSKEVDINFAPDTAKLNSLKAHKQTQQLRDQADALQKQRDSIKQISTEFVNSSNGARDLLAFEARMVGKSQDQVDLLTQQRDLYLQYASTRKQLEDRLKNLTPEERRLGLAQDINDEILKLKDTYMLLDDSLVSIVTHLQTQKLLEQDRLNTLQNITKEIDDQQSRYQSLGDIIRDVNGQIQGEQQQGKMGKMSNLQQQIETIKQNAQKAATEAGRTFAQSFEDSGDGLTPEKAKELANGLDQIAQKYKVLSDTQIANLENSRTFSAGWQEAFNNYVDSATNAANHAKNIFDSITNSMSSAIDNFVETGKFSFKDFAKSVIQDLIKIQLKASAMKLLSAFLPGLGSSFAGFFADGGYIPPGKYGVVGEAGPELVSGPASVTPGSQMGGQTVNNYITNNISAVDAKSVAQLFAQNRKTLLGATETARKEMPSRGR